jgi:cytochrome oxidase Cu insertion factor (SCO1/SenC/PrrC family)
MRPIALAACLLAALALAARAAADFPLGKPAPAFTLKQISGKPVSLADYKGKVVVLAFWEPG